MFLSVWTALDMPLLEKLAWLDCPARSHHSLEGSITPALKLPSLDEGFTMPVLEEAEHLRGLFDRRERPRLKHYFRVKTGAIF